MAGRRPTRQARGSAFESGRLAVAGAGEPRRWSRSELGESTCGNGPTSSAFSDATEYPVAAETQPEFAGVLALKRFHVAHPGDRVMIRAIGARLIGPLDAKSHSL
jgi:hypothetical protein